MAKFGRVWACVSGESSYWISAPNTTKGSPYVLVEEPQCRRKDDRPNPITVWCALGIVRVIVKCVLQFDEHARAGDLPAELTQEPRLALILLIVNQN